MKLAQLYLRGELTVVDENERRKLAFKAQPNLYTSFRNRIGSTLLGFFLTPFGLACIYFLFFPGQRVGVIYKIILAIGSLCFPFGIFILYRSYRALSTKAHIHQFFYYDKDRTGLGSTKKISQNEIREINRAKEIQEKIDKIKNFSSDLVEIPIISIDRVEIKPLLSDPRRIEELIIHGGESVIKVNIGNIVPTTIILEKNLMAFNSISIFYTNATGKTIEAVTK